MIQTANYLRLIRVISAGKKQHQVGIDNDHWKLIIRDLQRLLEIPSRGSASEFHVICQFRANYFNFTPRRRAAQGDESLLFAERRNAGWKVIARE